MPDYVLLMSSLPPLGKLFEATQEPISWLKLESRLKLLEPRDAETLSLMASLISWSAQQSEERTDEEFVAQADRFFQQVRNPVLREIVESRLTVRTIIAALRRRHRGESEPPIAGTWGYGPWVPSIARNWKHPSFNLEAVFPWIPEANDLIAADDLVGLERLQFTLNWKMLDRVGAGHHFDFEALIVYLNRWSLVARWSRYNGAKATSRFHSMVSAGLNQFTDIFATESPA